MFHPLGPSFWELARQALSSTRRGYDLLAPKFDYTPFRTPDSILDAVVPFLGPPQTIAKALDVCCGTGAAMRMLRPHCRDCIVGVDFSERMLSVGRERTKDVPGNAALHWVQADVLNMPFRNQFDVTTCFGALGHIPQRDQARFVDQIALSLRPGGRFVFASSFKPPVLSRAYWLSRSFNAAMHARNLLVSPPFVMFYLTFLVPEAKSLLEARGFCVQIHQHVFHQPYTDACLIVAEKGTE